jgi:Uma2 family endonuclease
MSRTFEYSYSYPHIQTEKFVMHIPNLYVEVNIPTQNWYAHPSFFFFQISNVTKGGEHRQIDSTLIGDFLNYKNRQKNMFKIF